MTKVDLQNKYRIILIRAVFCLVTIPFANDAIAQGKLGQLRAAVRPANNDAHQDHSSHDEDHEDHDDRRRHRSERHDSHDLSFGGFLSSCTSVCHSDPTPVVVEYYSTRALVCPGPAPELAPYSPIVANQLAHPTGDQVLSEQVISDTVYDGNDSLERVGEDWFTSWFMRGSAIAGGGQDDMTLAGVSLLAQVPGAIGLDLGVKTWRENSTTYRDHLWIGDANVVYEFANHQDLRARLGVGVNWLNDQWGSESGLNLTAGVDIRLTERLLLALEGDVGTLGASDFLHSQISLSRRFEKSELVLGYDYYDIGGVELQGVFGGLQFRF